MANDGKIYITISDTRGGKGDNIENNTGGEKKDKKEKSLASFARHKFFNLIESEAKTVVNYSIGNIGNFTGSYQMQRNIQTSMSAINFLVNLGTSAYVGAKTTGSWVGAAFAVGVSLISTGVKTGLEIHAEQFENRRINRNIDIMRERLGLEGLTNGSRTGGY